MQSDNWKNEKVQIHSDSQAAILSLKSTLIKNERALKARRNWDFLAQRNSINLVWTKAHVDTYGNEAADRLAKLGTTRRNLQDIKFSWAVIK